MYNNHYGINNSMKGNLPNNTITNNNNQYFNSTNDYQTSLAIFQGKQFNDFIQPQSENNVSNQYIYNNNNFQKNSSEVKTLSLPITYQQNSQTLLMNQSQFYKYFNNHYQQSINQRENNDWNRKNIIPKDLEKNVNNEIQNQRPVSYNNNNKRFGKKSTEKYQYPCFKEKQKQRQRTPLTDINSNFNTNKNNYNQIPLIGRQSTSKSEFQNRRNNNNGISNNIQDKLKDEKYQQYMNLYNQYQKLRQRYQQKNQQNQRLKLQSLQHNQYYQQQIQLIIDENQQLKGRMYSKQNSYSSSRMPSQSDQGISRFYVQQLQKKNYQLQQENKRLSGLLMKKLRSPFY